jgi:hypothetical protein
MTDFLMHGVVLQNRVFEARGGPPFYAEMFHVKHRTPDVHVKPFSPAPRAYQPLAPRCFT